MLLVWEPSLENQGSQLYPKEVNSSGNYAFYDLTRKEKVSLNFHKYNFN